MVPAANKTLVAVLGMLSLRPMSGYDVKKTIEQSIGNFWNESFGQIYPMLQRLVDEGLAVELPSKGHDRRCAFAITPRGRAALRGWLREPARIRPSRNETLLKLFLAIETTPTVTLSHLRRFRRLHTDALERYAALESQLRSAHAGNPRLPYWLIALDYGRRESEALLAWCDEAERKIHRFTEKKKKEKS